MFEDIMNAMKSLAMMPTLKPMFLRGAREEFTKIMNIIQSLAAIDPFQGVQGAVFALREFLSGDLLSLQRRFELSAKAVAASIGATVAQIKQSPELALKALEAFTKANVGAETLRKTALTIDTQLGNLVDRFKQYIDEISKATGIHKKFVAVLIKLNEIWGKILKSEAVAAWANAIAEQLGRVFQKIQSIITGFDWDQGNPFKNLVDLAHEAMNELVNLWNTYKDKIASAAKETMRFVAKEVYKITKEVFIPVGIAMGKGIFVGLWEALTAPPISKKTPKELGLLAKKSAEEIEEITSALDRLAQGYLTAEENLEDFYNTPKKQKAITLPALPPTEEELKLKEELAAKLKQLEEDITTFHLDELRKRKIALERNLDNQIEKLEQIKQQYPELGDIIEKITDRETKHTRMLIEDLTRAQWEAVKKGLINQLKATENAYNELEKIHIAYLNNTGQQNEASRLAIERNYNKQLENLDEMLDAGLIKEKDYNTAREELYTTTELKKARVSKSFFDQVAVALYDLKKEWGNWAKEAYHAVKSFAQDAQRMLSDMFFNFITGQLGDMKEALKNFGRAMIRTMTDIAAKLAVIKIVEWLFEAWPKLKEWLKGLEEIPEHLKDANKEGTKLAGSHGRCLSPKQRDRKKLGKDP
jgi:hypothetical protein